MEEEKISRDDENEALQITSKTSKGNIHCITIAGQIEGHIALPQEQKATKYETMMPRLAAIEESDDIEGLLILVNTAGGDVEAGLAIAELIAGMRKPTVSLVLGGGHSIGVPLAVAAKKTFIAPSAAMTIHPVRVNGTVIGVWQAFEYFQKIQDRIIKFVVDHSNISEEEFKKLMLETGELTADIGTIVDGERATKIGLCDYTGGLSDALDELHKMIKENKKNDTDKESK